MDGCPAVWPPGELDGFGGAWGPAGCAQQTPGSPHTHQVLGPDCTLYTDQETEAQRGLSDLPGVEHGLRKRRGQGSNLGLARGSQYSELTACTHVWAHAYTYTQCCVQAQVQRKQGRFVKRA